MQKVNRKMWVIMVGDKCARAYLQMPISLVRLSTDFFDVLKAYRSGNKLGFSIDEITMWMNQWVKFSSINSHGPNPVGKYFRIKVLF